MRTRSACKASLQEEGNKASEERHQQKALQEKEAQTRTVLYGGSERHSGPRRIRGEINRIYVTIWLSDETAPNGQSRRSINNVFLFFTPFPYTHTLSLSFLFSRSTGRDVWQQAEPE